jgi:hypothetical protein
MSINVRLNARPVMWLLGLMLFFAAGAHVSAAQEGSKGIQPEALGVGNRPKPKARAAKKPRGTYRTAKRFIPAAAPAGREFAQLGVTIWRLRPSVSSDQAKELIDSGESGGKKEWTLERVEGDTELAIGEKVRLSIESLSHRGYLYVVDREQYADGSRGAARLIFPTLRTRRGNNYVEPGQLIDIPPSPRYFNIRQSEPGKLIVAEVLTLLLTQKPLELPSSVSEKAMTLPEKLLTDWEQRWKTEAVQLELEGGAGQALTAREQTVIRGNAKDLLDDDREELTQEDPLPQTVYHATIRQGDAVFVTVSLRIK